MLNVNKDISTKPTTPFVNDNQTQNDNLEESSCLTISDHNDKENVTHQSTCRYYGRKIMLALGGAAFLAGSAILAYVLYNKFNTEYIDLVHRNTATHNPLRLYTNDSIGS